MKKYYTGYLAGFLVLMVWSCTIAAQDIHFTQFYRSNQTLNPALTGDFRGVVRAGMIYSDQWNSISPENFNSVVAFAERKFLVSDDYVNIGVMAASDKSGPVRMGNQLVEFTGAYHNKIGPVVLLSGLQAGVAVRSINSGTYPAQYNHYIGGFDPDLPNQESNLSKSSANFDLNAGLGWKYESEGFDIVVGQSIYHVNKPDVSLVEGYKWHLSPRYVTHASADVKITNAVALLPSTVFKRHNKATEFLLGSMVRLGSPQQELRFLAGSFYRNNIRGYRSTEFGKNVDAVSLNLGLLVNSFNIGLAYDFNISDLHEASNYRGAFEFALTYTYGIQVQPDRKEIPCYRF